MASWHQSRNVEGNRALHTAPVKGHKVVIDPPGGFACAITFSRKRDAQRYFRRMPDKRGAYIISANGDRHG